MSAKECAVCCEKFSVKLRVKVSCNYCDFECCRQCIQKYLTEITNDPHCMQCKNAWNREFIDEACTKTFRNEKLKKHRENILFEREKCFLPDAQVILAHRKECERLTAMYTERVRELYIEIHAINAEIDNVRMQKVPQTERRKFVRKCPVAECRGFLSTQWKCEVCENKICHECNEVKNDDVVPHECDPSNIETMKLLKKDTKPCPNCGTMIFKISGCAQMWCPDCHTAFDWNTLAIEKGVIHNPHFFEFHRMGGTLTRNPGDIPCGGIPHVEELYQSCNAKLVRRGNGRYAEYQIPAETKFVFDFCQMITHIERVEMVHPVYDNSLELRIRYLKNEMSEEVYKSTLQKNEKAREKRRDLNNIFTMIVHTGSDILRQFVNKEITLEQIKEIVTNLISYTNTTLQAIGKRYTCVVPQIEEFELFRLQPQHHGRNRV